MKTKPIVIVYWIFACLYLGLAVFAPYPGSFLIKCVPALGMSYLLFSSKKPVLKAMAIGYIFSAIGDVLLDIDRIKLFVFGLAAFHIAHIFYSVTLFKLFKRENVSFIKIGGVLGFVLGMLVMIFPNLGNLAVPVVLYVLVIATMGVAASMIAPGLSLPFIGALVFIFSDATIAVDKFLTTVPFARALIMVTYFIGNFMIGYFTFKTVKSLDQNSSNLI